MKKLETPAYSTVQYKKPFKGVIHFNMSFRRHILYYGRLRTLQTLMAEMRSMIVTISWFNAMLRMGLTSSLSPWLRPTFDEHQKLRRGQVCVESTRLLCGRDYG